MANKSDIQLGVKLIQLVCLALVLLWLKQLIRRK